MANVIIARNYAETLLALAQRNGGAAAVNEFGAAIDEVSKLLRQEPLVRDFLETPRVDLEGKKKALEASFRGRVPELFLRFLLVLMENRRQGIIGEIAEQYHALVDEVHGRARAKVTLAKEADESLRKEIVTSLERRLAKTVVPTFEVDPSLIGGVIIRVGDEILDGSLSRRIAGMRRRLLDANVPSPALAGD